MKKKYLILSCMLLMLIPSLLMNIRYLDVWDNYLEIVFFLGVTISIASLRDLMFALIVTIIIINSIVLLLVIMEK